MCFEIVTNGLNAVVLADQGDGTPIVFPAGNYSYVFTINDANWIPFVGGVGFEIDNVLMYSIDGPVNPITTPPTPFTSDGVQQILFAYDPVDSSNIQGSLVVTKV